MSMGYSDITLKEGCSQELMLYLLDVEKPSTFTLFIDSSLSIQEAKECAAQLKSANQFLETIIFTCAGHYNTMYPNEIQKNATLLDVLLTNGIAYNPFIQQLEFYSIPLFPSSLGKLLRTNTSLKNLSFSKRGIHLVLHQEGLEEGVINTSTKKKPLDGDVIDDPIKDSALMVDSAVRCIGTLGSLTELHLTAVDSELTSAILLVAAVGENKVPIQKLTIGISASTMKEKEIVTARALGSFLSSHAGNHLESLVILFDNNAHTVMTPVLQGLMKNNSVVLTNLNFVILSIVDKEIDQYWMAKEYGLMGDNHIIQGVSQQMEDLLRTNTRLISFRLHDYGALSLMSILYGLRDNQSITKVSLDCLINKEGIVDNSISTAMIGYNSTSTAICDLLCHNDTIQELELETYNHVFMSPTILIDDEWVVGLAQGLSNNATLKKLTMTSIAMSPGQIVTILRSLHSNTTLDELRIDFEPCMMNNELFIYIGDCLPSITGLKRLFLCTDYNDVVFSEQAQLLFVNNARQNYSLQLVLIGGMQYFSDENGRMMVFCFHRNRFQSIFTDSSWSNNTSVGFMGQILHQAFQKTEYYPTSIVFWLLRCNVARYISSI